MKKKVKTESAILDVQTGLSKWMRFLVAFFLLGITVLGSVETALAQAGSTKLSGLVKDEDGMSLPGVTVLVKGTSNGTITNNEGRFSLVSSQAKGTLVFSFVGLQTMELPFDGDGSFSPVLKSSSIDLEEIVAVNMKGLYFGIGASVLFTAYALLTSIPVVWGGNERLLLDLGRLNFTHHEYMIGVYSHLLLLVFGYVASLFFKRENNIRALTYYGYLDLKRQK